MVDKTIQVNLRLPESLVADLEFVCRLKKVQKNEWIKIRLAEVLEYEREELSDRVTKRYVKGYIDDDLYYEKMGIHPSDNLKQLRKLELTKKQTDSTVGAKNYIKQSLKK